MSKNLIDDLKKLRLNYLAGNLESFASGCDKEKRSTSDVIEKLSYLELVEKERRGTERRLQAAKLGRFKKIHDFDWNWPKGLNKTRIEELMKGDFIDLKRNILLAGAQGLGKTMIAKNIGYQAAINGKKVFFTTASDLVLTLKSKGSQSERLQGLRKFSSPDLLIIDELGYLSYDCEAADLLFEVINRGYETGSIVFTTNLAFKDWNKIFPAAACLTAMIDRITHHLDVIKIEGQSYRLMESKRD